MRAHSFAEAQRSVLPDQASTITIVAENHLESVHANPPFNPLPVSAQKRYDHFVERDGQRFAGTHLLIDLHDAQRLDDLEHIEAAMRAAIAASNATLLHIHLHHFTPNGGVSGVAVLAESHISVHTWPECGYAAFDIFMCGDARPELGADVLREAFQAKRFDVVEHRRGMVNHENS